MSRAFKDRHMKTIVNRNLYRLDQQFTSLAVYLLNVSLKGQAAQSQHSLKLDSDDRQEGGALIKTHREQKRERPT